MKRWPLVTFGLFGVGLVPFAMLSKPAASRGDDPAVAARAVQAEALPLKPVEEDAHEFMEHLNGPVFERLKKVLAEEPKDKQVWQQTSSYALVLAEAGNLLMIRPPDKDSAPKWNELAAGVRDVGAELYQAAKKRRYNDARTHLAALAKRCNACHDEFSNGEPVVEP